MVRNLLFIAIITFLMIGVIYLSKVTMALFGAIIILIALTALLGLLVLRRKAPSKGASFRSFL